MLIFSPIIVKLKFKTLLCMKFKVTKNTQNTLISRSNKLYMTHTVNICAAFHKELFTGLSV